MKNDKVQDLYADSAYTREQKASNTIKSKTRAKYERVNVKSKVILVNL